MVELFDEASVARWTPLVSPFDMGAAGAYLDRARLLRAEDRGIQLAITTDGRAPLGEILLFRTGEPGEAELAYAVGAAHRGRGLAARAVTLMARHARTRLGLPTALLCISDANHASAAVARACGFKLTSRAPFTRPTSRDPLYTWSKEGP